jgi:hypothetical protein
MTEPLRTVGRRLRLCLIVLAVTVSAFAVFAASASAKVHSLHFQTPWSATSAA